VWAISFLYITPAENTMARKHLINYIRIQTRAWTRGNRGNGQRFQQRLHIYTFHIFNPLSPGAYRRKYPSLPDRDMEYWLMPFGGRYEEAEVKPPNKSEIKTPKRRKRIKHRHRGGG
jgi:hypothetical protein